MPTSNPQPTSVYYGWTLQHWSLAYRKDALSPAYALTELLALLSTADNAWISLVNAQQLQQQLAELEQRRLAVAGDLGQLPLYGVPFAVKDNIDVQGLPTTAACPAYAYMPQADALVVAKLKAAGAVVLGKTNLDQFATGLVGTRSPYGTVVNSFNADYISGGSSSGSASVVARGWVPFSLGTDTAGSGRVPAAFNNIVGLKPTKGWLSTSGVVAACRTQDCVSVFALTVADAELVAELAGGYDPHDPYSRPNPATETLGWSGSPRLAIPEQLEFFGDILAEQAFEQTRTRLLDLGVMLEPIDFRPFQELAALLYAGPWVAERYITVESLLNASPQSLDATVCGIIQAAQSHTAISSFKAEYRRARLAQQIQQILAKFDALLVPTTPSIYAIADIAADPVRLNTNLGTYTNFTNLADLSALALPAGFRADGLPHGISLIAPAWHDAALARFGRLWQTSINLPMGATGQSLIDQPQSHKDAYSVLVAVVGAHLTGMPLNFQLTSRNAVLIESCRTASCYRLYALANTTPPKPGLAKSDSGQPILVELWQMPLARFGEFVAEIPPPLGIGNLLLDDGRTVKGFICEAYALAGAVDITDFGGWRAYIDHLKGAAHV